MTLEIVYDTCLDCLRLGGCSKALAQSKKEGPTSVLELSCGRHKRCHPTTVLSRKDALEMTGLLALRGLIESHTTKEDMTVTREEREEELKSLGRMDLRSESIKAGMPHRESLKGASEDMIALILDKEYPDEGEGAAPVRTKKAATRKPAARKGSTAKSGGKKDPTNNEVTGSVTAEEVATIVAEQLTPVEEVMSSHSDVLTDIQNTQVGVVKILHSFLCLSLEPDLADELVQEAGLGDLLTEEEGPSGD